MSTLKDLNKHLFDQLDRLATADAKTLDTEVTRSQTCKALVLKLSRHTTPNWMP